jgi:putative membrane protein
MNTRSILMCSITLVLATACATTDMQTMPGAMPENDVAGIVRTANQGEVEQGQAASSRAQSADVRSFASMMVTDHTAALNRANEVWSRNNITPTDNETSRTLADNSRRTISALSTYTGTAFDRQYMQAQVDLHQWLLTSLDTTLIPSARTPENRTLLQTQRGSVATHLERARQILNGLR